MTPLPPPGPTPRRRSRRAGWVLLTIVALLGLAAWFAPALLGQWALRQFGGDVVTAEGVGGRLWSPGLRGARVRIPGVDAAAQEASVRVTGVDPRTRTLRLDVAVRDGTVNLRLGDLLRRGPASEEGGKEGWRVVLGGLDVQGTRVNVDGAGLNVPDGRFRVSPLPDGRLAVRGQTRQGELNANVTVREGDLGNRFLLDVDADARVINHYWPGVTGGRITGQYAVGGGDPIRGDLRVRGASLRVPDAGFVTVQDVNGTLAHRGDRLALRLAGRGWDGPVTARATANTRQHRWDVTAEATPRVAGLARALGTTGEGTLRLRATAGGWNRAEVRAEATGAGRFAGVPFRDLRAGYTFASPNKKGDLPEENTLTFQADTRLNGKQTLAGEWTFGRSGRATWAGDFAGKPLDVRAGVDARNLVTLAGEGLGGPLAGRYSLRTQALRATLNPTYGAASARVALSGTPRDLRARVTNGAAGPFRLEGTARLDGQGLRADLGAVRLDLNRDFRGGWTLQGLSGAGVTLSGGGNLDLSEGLLGGTLAADVPGVTETLRGPVALNLPGQRGTFQAGAQRLVWNGDAFTLTARELPVAGGARVSGAATVTAGRRVTGTLTARGNGYDLTATGRGDYADLRGTAGGVTVSARTVVADDFRTTAQVEGAEIAGEFALEDGGVRFALTTAGPGGERETARGVLSGQSWDATGRVNLAALRPLVGRPDLAGTLDLALAGTGGTAEVDARVAGASVAGTLTRRGGEVTADLRGAYADAVARLSGRVYPDVAASGPVTWQGQTLAASVAGPYSDLRARLTGRTTPLTQAGVTLPGQAVNLTATLTPRLAASGTWGDLRVRYDARTGLVAIEGTQALTAFGRAGRVQGAATWGPDFVGEVRARGTLEGGYAVALAGPWRALDVTAQGPGGLRASGTAGLPEAAYDLRVRGPLEGFYVDGRVRGTGAEPRGTLDVFDGAGGAAQVTLRGLSDFDVRARQLTLAGQPLVGDLTARGGRLSGTLNAGPLRLVARDGRVDASGEFGGHRLTARGRLTLPATLQDLRVNVTGPLLTATATGDVENLRGTVRLRPQSFGEGTARASLPAQTFPLTANLTGPRVTVGGLTYAAGRWDGGLGVRYTLGGRAGTVALRGGGQALAARPSGPLTGRVNLLPELGGQLQTDLSPFLAGVPDDLRAELVAGNLIANVTPDGATLSSSGSRYLGQPLGLRARVDWRDGVRASGTLTHPGSRVPFAYDGRDLRVRGAVLDARALRPLVEASGRVTADLTVPGLDFGRANGRLGVNLTAAGERVRGQVTLANGQPTGELRAGPLRLTARDGGLALTGEAAGHTLTATGRLRGLSRVSDLRANVTGPYLEANAAGDLTALRGVARLRPQTFGVGAASLKLPTQTLALTAAPTAGRITLGGLTFSGGRWTGEAALRYTLGGRAGTVAVRGGGRTLAALPSGPLIGRVNLLPMLGGRVQADLSSLRAGLPEGVRRDLTLGWLLADLTADGATLRTGGSLYLGQPLTLRGAASWRGGVRATAELTHPGSRIPLTYDGRDLRVRGAVVDGSALRPFVEATGRVTADLTVPELDFGRADGRLGVNLTAAGERVTGRITLWNGVPNGELRAGPLRLTARDGGLALTGEVAEHTLTATARLRGLSEVSDVRASVTGPYLEANAAGDLMALRGNVRVQQQSFGADAVRLVLPAQTLPLTAAPTAGRVSVGDLTFAGGRWDGGTNLRYTLGGRTGTVAVRGGGRTLAALPSGPLAGRVNLLPRLGGQLQTNLSPLLASLPADLRAELVAGQLVADVTPDGATLSTSGSRYLGQPLGLRGAVSWRGGVRATAELTHPGTRIPLTYDGRDLRVRGAVLDASALRPLVEATGRVTADLTVPELDFGRASGRADVALAAAGQSATGRVTLTRGQLAGDLASDLGGVALRVHGPLYPRADAVLTLDEVHGTLTGNAAETLTLRAAGRYGGRAIDLTAVGRSLTGPDASATLRGTVAGGTLALNLGRIPDDWAVTGQVDVPDLGPLAGTAGRVSGTVSGTLREVRLDAGGEVAGVTFRAPATYVGGVLRVQGGTGTLPNGLGTFRVSGPVFPELRLSAKASLRDALPGEYTGQVLGTFAKPDVRVQGTLSSGVGSSGVSGLQAAGTRVTARLFGRDWKADLGGEALAGTVRGRLGSGALAGLQTARLNVHAPYVAGDTRVRLDGVTGWNARTGWLGDLRATGTVPGGALAARLTGAGPLALSASVGPARVTGSFPADLPLRPGGTLDLAALDVGALWERPGQLRATGQATLEGATWAGAGATFAGRLDDVEGELSGDVGATYRAGNVSLRLAGERLSGGGTLEGGRYRLNVRAEPVRLARLLPPGWDVDALTFGGTVEASGTLTGGPLRVEARNLALRGEQREAGPFSLYGRAVFSQQPGTQGRLEAELDGSLRGGVLWARGTLPDGVRVTVRDVDARAFGAGQVGGDLTLTGPLRDLRVSGEATARADEFDALATLSGPVQNARAHARLTLKGEGRSGILYADARDLDLGGGTLRARVYGTARQGRNDLTLDLEGTWPRLAGTATARVGGVPAPVTLRGDGRGSYALAAGTLGEGTLTLTDGEGFVPDLGGTLRLRPLALVEGSAGEAAAEVTLSGPLTAPRLSGTLETRGAEAFGVTLADTRGSFGGTLAELRGTLTQGTDPVATLEGRRLTLSGLTLGAAGGTLRASGTASLDVSPTADLTLTAAGELEGNVRAAYRARALDLNGTLGAAGLRAALDVNADALTGWHGTVRVTGGPDGVLTQPAVLRLDGPLARPLVSGEAGLLGAGARIVATPDGVQVRLVDGPGAEANGVLEVRPDEAGNWHWLGTAALTRPELSLSVTPQGPLADPRLTLSLRRGEWRAAGEASLRAADLDVTDGERTGQLTWGQDVLRAELPGLDLGRLNLEGVTGRLTANGSANTASGEGRVALRVTNVTTTYEVPYLGLTLGGDLSAEITLAGGRPSVTATAALPAGTVNLTATQGQGGWTGRLTGSVRREDGTLTADVTAGTGGLTGTLAAARYPLDLPGLDATGQGVRLDGEVALQGQTFAANLSAVNTVGAARVTGTGGLADVLPALEALGTLRPTGDGYRLRARLDEVELAELALAPGLAGRVSGEATLNDGGGTVVLTSPALTIGPKQLGARVEGTLIGGDWRLRGFLGESDFLASLTGGVLSGQATLQALPLGALTAAVTGTSVGEGVVTGVARFRFPLADPLAGSATVVAERIRVTATSGTGAQAVTETLTGTGTLDYANRELRNVNIQLAGAGTWDVRGGYTRERVDLQARFDGTTFTPVLRLIPGLAGLDPSLKGTVTLSAAGTYDRPRGLLRAQNLAGSVAGLSVQVPVLEGDLPDSGAFTASGRVLTGGVLGSDGTLEVRGQLNLGRLSGTTATFRGLLAPQALGALPNSVVTVTQAAADRWTVEASSRTPATAAGPTGTLRLTGALTPRLDLTLTAQGYTLPISVISARDSSLDADLRLVDDGTVVRVSGAASFARLVLGRTDAVATIPPPGQSTAGTDGRPTDNFPSPLPPEYTTFPDPAGEDGGNVPAPVRPLLERLVFEDIPIRAPGGIRVEEALARAEFGGGLVLSGTGARPRLTGEIVAERGSLFLRENEFTLREGRVTFAGDGLYPSFALNAAGTVAAVTTRQRVPVVLDVRGQFEPQDNGQSVLNLQTTLSCAPGANGTCADPVTRTPYTEAQLYALVATGVPNLDALPENLASLGASALQTALNIFVLGELERNVARALGLDVFRLTPNLATEGGEFGATITLGSYLTRNLYLQYQVDLTGEGLLDATYTTPDGRLSFQVSTPLGLGLQAVRPSISAAYNFGPRSSVSVGVANDEDSTTFRFGVTYRFFGR